MNGGENGIGGPEIRVRLILAIAILTEQIDIRCDTEGQACHQLPLEGAVGATEEVEAGAIGPQRTTEAAHAETAANSNLQGVGQRIVIGEIDHVGDDLIAAGCSEGASAVERSVVLREGEFVLQAKAFGPFVTDRDCADGTVVGIHLGVEDCRGRHGRHAIASLAIPAATQPQIPAIAGQCRRRESRGGNSRHGEQTKFHFSTLAENTDRQGPPTDLSEPM
jgi:hypothetical protein